MFDNIAKLRFVDGSNGEHNANAMLSAEGEIMEFRTAVVAEGKVEDWMTEVLQEMRRTNRLITKEAIFRYCEGMTRSDIYNSSITYSLMCTYVCLYVCVLLIPAS